jgi:hypothetical protein
MSEMAVVSVMSSFFSIVVLSLLPFVMMVGFATVASVSSGGVA